MKIPLPFGAVLAVSLAVVPFVTQAQTTTYIESSKIIGKKINTERGEEVGVVKDIVLDQSTGCLAYTVVSTGGTTTRLTGQGKLVAVPWSVYSVAPESGAVTVRVERDRIYSAPVFEYSRIREYSTSGYINNVNSYFGASAQFGSSRTTTGTATTNQQTTVGQSSAGSMTTTQSPMPQSPAPQSPAPMTSPAATMSPAQAASPAAKETASPMATASPRSTRAKDREETTSGESGKKMTPSSSHRHHETTPGEKEEQSTMESPSTGEKKSARHHKTREETTEPAATPKEQEEPPQ